MYSQFFKPLKLSLIGFVLATFTVAPKVWAADPASVASEGIPAGYESYSSRPDVLKLKPQAHANLGADWAKLKRGHTEAIAMLLEMYPDREIYFLARDSELLYDLAKHVTRNEPQLHARLHLLNVSRANMRAEHIKEYLAQEGISEAVLKSGKKILFVDTGFSGTIPRVVSEYFSPGLRPQLQTHLMSSSNPAHPSSRVFLTSINPATPALNPGAMHGSIISYEHMARFTDRSDRYQNVNGRWEPLSRKEGASDGSVSQVKARAYMEDLLAYASEAESLKLLELRRTQWRNLKTLSQTPGLKSEQLQGELKALLQAHPNDPFTESLVRDFVEVNKIHFPGTGPGISVQELGLVALDSAAGGSSNKNALIAKYPEWASVLEDPQTGISKLIAASEFGKLGAITDAIKDSEFASLLAKALGKDPPTSGTKLFIQMLIEKGDAFTLQYLAQHTFSQPHTVGMKDQLKLLIEKGDAKTLHLLAQHTFSQPHTAGMKDQLKLLVEKGDDRTLKNLAVSTFSKPHTAEMKEQLKLLIEKGDTQTLQLVAFHIFSQPHTAGMKDQLKLLIEKGDAFTLECLATSTFSKPHTAEMKDQLKLLIEKGDSVTLGSLAKSTFSQPHTAEMKDLLTLLIEKGDVGTLGSLATYTFSESHWNLPQHADLKQASQIIDPNKRREFLAQHFPLEAKTNAPAATTQISSLLEAGNQVRTKKGLDLEVLLFVDEGKRGRVYKVRDSGGQLYALKVARDALPETLASLAQESQKAAAYQKLGVPHATITEAQPDYVLKQWVEGERADVWMKAWVAQGSKEDAPQIQALFKLIEKSSKQGAYIGDLNAKNLIWQNDQWVVIDSGSIRDNMTVNEAMKRYFEKIPSRWGKAGGANCLLKVLEAIKGK